MTTSRPPTSFPQPKLTGNEPNRLWKTWLGGLVVGAVVLLAACGGGAYEFVGFTRDPAPSVDVAEVPDVSRDAEPFRFVAAPGELLVVFFGYTNCPDVCPATLADLRRALTDLGEDAEHIDMVMVTIDPARDADVVTDYVQGFVPDAHAVALDDDAVLQQVAFAFGVSYQVDVRSGGRVDVVHSDTTLFAVDDTGTLLLTWPFGTTPDELADDLRQLLKSGVD